MKTMDAIALDKKYLMQTYNRFGVTITRGKGAYVWGDDGKKYLDFVAGVAVNNAGHCHPAIVKAIREQAAKLIHASNWFYNEKQSELAELLVGISPKGLKRVFLCNSGTEAVEAALKLARKKTRKHKFITMEKSFHGRTMGSLAITWKEHYRKPYEPLMPGAVFVEYGNADAARKALDGDVAAVIVEPVQGEGGVNVPPEGYLRELRELCSEKGVLLIMDEIQTGFGRCGRMFACEEEGVLPDIMCVAKGLGGGFPIGAIVVTEEASSAWEAGDHGTTFGGNPLGCAAAVASLKVLVKEKLHLNAGKMGRILLEGLNGIESKKVKAVRGKGLLVGVEVHGEARPFCERLIKHGLLTSCPTKSVIRYSPPLMIGRMEAGLAVKASKEVLS